MVGLVPDRSACEARCCSQPLEALARVVDSARKLALRRLDEFDVSLVQLTSRDAPDAVRNGLVLVQAEGLFRFALRLGAPVPYDLPGDRCGAKDRRRCAGFPARAKAAVSKGTVGYSCDALVLPNQPGF
jgi:hypothetical protein